MKHIFRSFICLALLLCLSVIGCTEQRPNDLPGVTEDQSDPAPPADPLVFYEDTDVVTVTTEHGSITPQVQPSWSESYNAESHQWESADGVSALDWLAHASAQELTALPALSLGDSLRITLPKGMTLQWSRCYLRTEQDPIDLTTVGSASTVGELHALLQDLGEGEYYVHLSLNRKGAYIEGEGKHESTGYDALFRYSNLPPAPPPVSNITIQDKPTSQLMFWWDNRFETPQVFYRWSERDGYSIDCVTDLGLLESSNSFIPDEQFLLQPGTDLSVQMPNFTEYTGFVIYLREGAAKYTRLKTDVTDLKSVLSTLESGDWFIGLNMKTIKAEGSSGWTVYIRYPIP